MPAVDKSLDGEDLLEPPSNKQTTPYSVSLSGMPMHIYPYPPPALIPTQQPVRSKRRQVKKACTHCQKACKKCDDARPCLRCVKYGVSEECVDSQRKERQKGIKRGPYKKRDGKDRAGSSVEHSDVPQTVPATNNVPSQGGSQIPASYMPLGHPPGYYGHYPPLVSKPGDGLPVYPNSPYFLASIPHVQPQMHASEGDNNGYPTQGFYPAPVFAPVAYHPQYVSRSDGQGSIPTHYSVYGTPVYPRHSSWAGQGEIQHDGTTRNEQRDRVSNRLSP